MELALAELERQKSGVEEEIAAIRAELGGTGSAVSYEELAPSAGTGRGRTRTPAERKAHSEKMRQYWAKRRGQAGKPAAAESKQAARMQTKTRRWTAAQKEALALKLKAAWKKRKAEAVKSTKTK